MFCTKVWKKCGGQNDCELFVLNEEVLPHSEMPYLPKILIDLLEQW